MSNQESGFIEVGKSGQPLTGVNTQLKFIKYMIQNKDILNELLYRFNNRIIIQDIQDMRINTPGLDMNLRIDSSVSNNENPSLYITYYKNNIQVFHMSFHLCPNCINRRTTGLIHFKQNNSKNKTRNKQSKTNKTARVVTILGRPNNGNMPYFSLGKMLGINISNEYKNEASIVLGVLNEYFSKNSDLFLGKTVNHREYMYTNDIYNRMVKSVQKLNSTKRIKR